MSFVRSLWARKSDKGVAFALATTLTVFAWVWLVAIELSVSLDPATSLGGFLHAADAAASAKIVHNWLRSGLGPVVVIALLSRLFFYFVYTRFAWLAADRLGSALRDDRNPVDVVSMLSSGSTLSATWLDRVRRLFAFDSLLKWAAIALALAATLTTVLA
ncbi:MAG: hypothetical protein M3Z29_10930, partial [Pseudomonadota bacterium]|nr:hypothetical protein [Pseudomonadota bacterium]